MVVTGGVTISRVTGIGPFGVAGSGHGGGKAEFNRGEQFSLNFHRNEPGRSTKKGAYLVVGQVVVCYIFSTYVTDNGM